MALAAMSTLLSKAEGEAYAVGYFESWNLESLQAVVDAAEEVSSPVIVGFSGLFLPDPRRVAAEHLEYYAAVGREAAKKSSVPMALIFNESPCFDWLERAVELGFNAVMYSDETKPQAELVETHRRLADLAHARGAEVEAELGSLPGGDSDLPGASHEGQLTDPGEAARFVETTGVDALAISIGNVHALASRKVGLDMAKLGRIREHVAVPLVVHGGTGINDADLRQAIRGGISKVNVGTVLKRAFFDAIRESVRSQSDAYDAHKVLGSGLPEDVLVAARLAMAAVVKEKMRLFGSAGKA